jgi:hypothetical protein
VLNRLIESPATVKELSEELHLHKESIQWCVDVLRRMKLLYIYGYGRSQRGVHPRIWKAGAGVDAPRPEPMPTKEKSAAWRARGGDSHKTRSLRRAGQKIAKSMTLAGQAKGF